MAGHSKWANIKHKKERADAKKGKVFSRCAKEVISAVKMGGADPRSNTRLRLAIQKAKESNVPNDVIDRNIKKAASAEQADYHEMTYELYGHGGVGIVVDVMTDNKNRIASEMRIATNKRGGSVASPGSVTFNFDRMGVITFKKSDAVEDELFLAASEAGASDLDSDDENFMVMTDPADLYAVKENLQHHGFSPQEASLEMLPKSLVEVDQEAYDANVALIEWLEDLEDVDAVYHNMASLD
ncbi:MAG: YebC/PmpR family DNA-binding transcriptional regulator [Chlamydiia bacterium]|nr:YebC/PmpR family DNA-binding transcriptional regulator [Chlamydiia bacterium]